MSEHITPRDSKKLYARMETLRERYTAITYSINFLLMYNLTLTSRACDSLNAIGKATNAVERKARLCTNCRQPCCGRTNKGAGTGRTPTTDSLNISLSLKTIQSLIATQSKSSPHLMHNVGESIPNIPRKGCRHAQVAATRNVIQCGNKRFRLVVILSICSKSNVVIPYLSLRGSRFFRLTWQSRGSAHTNKIAFQ